MNVHTGKGLLKYSLVILTHKILTHCQQILHLVVTKGTCMCAPLNLRAVYRLCVCIVVTAC